MQKLLPLLGEGSSIVLTTSVANVKGIPGTGAYGAAKAALRLLARTLAAELVGRGIRVNAVSPGPIATPLGLKTGLSQEVVDEFFQQMAATNPMKRLGQPEEVARAVAYLAFEATYTTGAELAVDGGSAQL